MKCPLLASKGKLKEEAEIWLYPNCIKEECAWWDPKVGKCTVLRIWIALQDIHEVLHDIAKKIPKRAKTKE